VVEDYDEANPGKVLGNHCRNYRNVSSIADSARHSTTNHIRARWNEHRRIAKWTAV
jgi:hypothetical protein